MVAIMSSAWTSIATLAVHSTSPVQLLNLQGRHVAVLLNADAVWMSGFRQSGKKPCTLFCPARGTPPRRIPSTLQLTLLCYAHHWPCRRCRGNRHKRRGHVSLGHQVVGDALAQATLSGVEFHAFPCPSLHTRLCLPPLSAAFLEPRQL
jgi:hypothetical protein